MFIDRTWIRPPKSHTAKVGPFGGTIELAVPDSKNSTSQAAKPLVIPTAESSSTDERSKRKLKKGTGEGDKRDKSKNRN